MNPSVLPQRLFSPPRFSSFINPPPFRLSLHLLARFDYRVLVVLVIWDWMDNRSGLGFNTDFLLHRWAAVDRLERRQQLGAVQILRRRAVIRERAGRPSCVFWFLCWFRGVAGQEVLPSSVLDLLHELIIIQQRNFAWWRGGRRGRSWSHGTRLGVIFFSVKTKESRVHVGRNAWFWFDDVEEISRIRRKFFIKGAASILRPSRCSSEQNADDHQHQGSLQILIEGLEKQDRTCAELDSFLEIDRME